MYKIDLSGKKSIYYIGKTIKGNPNVLPVRKSNFTVDPSDDSYEYFIRASTLSPLLKNLYLYNAFKVFYPLGTKEAWVHTHPYPTLANGDTGHTDGLSKEDYTLKTIGLFKNVYAVPYISCSNKFSIVSANDPSTWCFPPQ